jgi:hypothetical protein
MIPYLKCMLIVAATTGLPPRVLPVIQSIEGGAPGMVRPDSNGTADLGVMQVNTIWVPALAARAGLPLADTQNRLVNDPCFNIAAAALIMRTYLAETHGELLPAIGDYHSHTPALNADYTALAERRARELFMDETP